MARANRHHIPNQVWHITHRCHKKEFLLKFARDRRRWYHWLFEAKKRFGLRVLNYAVTSNHIHLLVQDTEPDVIPHSLQLIAGRTGQEYNIRKSRQGAFWEDRYHATAIEGNEHLIRCLVYLDLNMVRAGVVNHPVEWDMNGYNEIQHPPQRYSVIDREALMRLCGFRDSEKFPTQYRQWVQTAIAEATSFREPCWTESIAVGSKDFIVKTQLTLGIHAKGRRVMENSGGRCFLREETVPYSTDFEPKNEVLTLENSFYWDEHLMITVK